jgi:SAM-dependent methyltransferase
MRKKTPTSSYLRVQNIDEMRMAAKAEANSTEILGDAKYVRERIHPKIGDLFYLCLSDLRGFLAAKAGNFEGIILDYGCGGSPYKQLFTRCKRYVGADMLPGPGVDLVLDSAGKTQEPPGTFDGVVSFQVLEHVQDPGAYLNECRRVLKEDGLLLLTTHGLYLEHKCPNDFYRWTSQGLEELVGAHGFKLVESVKLTTGIRGVLQLQHHVVEELIHEGFVWRALRRAYRVTCLPVLNIFAKLVLAKQASVPSSKQANMYVLVGVLARKEG